MKKKASEALASGMSPGAVRAFVNLGRYELDCEIPMSEPTPQPKKEEIVPVQFPVCWGEEYRVAPNAFFRSALFPALSSNEKENRRFVKNGANHRPAFLSQYPTRPRQALFKNPPKTRKLNKNPKRTMMNWPYSLREKRESGALLSLLLIMNHLTHFFTF